MAIDSVIVGALSSVGGKCFPMACSSPILSTYQQKRYIDPSIQASYLSPLAVTAGRRMGATRIGATRTGQYSFRTGLSLGRSTRLSNGSRWSAVWLDNEAQVETEVSISEAWDLWNDRARLNRWMPWIDSVKVMEDNPELSRWTLRYAAFGQNFEFSWLSRNMKPIHHQKIHWRSIDGLPNRGTVRFYPRSRTACGVKLTISYEVPEILAGLASAVAPLVERILQDDMNRFAKFAKSNQAQVST